MSSTLALHRGESATIARPLHAEAPLHQPFTLLDIYAPDGTVEATPRVDAIATISAGFKDAGRGLPQRSKDGKIHLHDPDGRAPGLKAALALTGDKSLTIAFPFDDLSSIIQQSFTEYSASNLLAHGDAHQITVLDPKRVGPNKRVVYKAGTPEYREAKDRCKVSTSIYFHLAQWTKDGPQVFFPDGLGLYRLRFTSRNSSRSIVASLQTTAKYMGGRIAGIPFQLSLENIEVAGPDGARRKVPVWRCIFATPSGFSLSSQNFRDVATKALAQGSALMLPAPRPETMELAMLEGPEADLDEITDAQVAEVAMGGKCDAAHYRRTWFATVKETPLDSDEARADFIAWYSAANGYEVVSSLSALLDAMNEEQAQHLMKSVRDEIAYQLEESKGTFNNLLQRGVELGLRRRELPVDATFAVIDTYTASLTKAIERVIAEQSPTDASEPVVPASEEVSEGVVVEPEAAVEEEPATMGTALRDTLNRAKTPTLAEQEEIERIFPDPPEKVEVATEDEAGLIPEHVVFLMNIVQDKGGLMHGGDFGFEPMIAAINAYRGNRRQPLPPIDSVAWLSKSEVDVLVLAIQKGDLEFGLV